MVYVSIVIKVLLPNGGGRYFIAAPCLYASEPASALPQPA